MQADGGFVEDEQGTHQRSAERRGEIDPLHLAAGKGARLAVEIQISQAHVAEIFQAGANFAQQEVDRVRSSRGQGERVEKPAALIDGQQHQVANVESGRAHPPQQGIGLQPGALTGSAFGVRAISREQHADVHLVGFGLEPGEEAPDAVPDVLGPFAFAIEDPVTLCLGQLAPWGVQGNRALACEFEEIRLAFLVGFGLPGLDGAATQRQRGIRDDEVVVDADDAAEAFAGLAGTDRRVEAEGARAGILVADITVRAMQIAGKAPRRCEAGLRAGLGLGRSSGLGGSLDVSVRSSLGVCLGCSGDSGLGRRFGLGIHVQSALPHLERCLDGVPCTGGVDARPTKPVLHHLQGIAPLLVDPRVALRGQQRRDFGHREIFRDGNRKGQQQTGVAGLAGRFAQGSADGLWRVAPHGPAAAAAVGNRRPREQQFQMIVELGHRADGGARRAHRIALIDGDRRWNAVDAVHQWLVHPVEKLPRIGRECLDVASLSLGVQGIEYE